MVDFYTKRGMAGRSLRWMAGLALGVGVVFLACVTLSAQDGATEKSQPDPKLAEQGEALAKERIALLKQGKLREGIAVLEKEIALERIQFRDAPRNRVQKLVWLSQLHQKADDLKAARDAYEQILNIHLQLQGKNGVDVLYAKAEVNYLDTLSRLTADQRKELDLAAKLIADAFGLKKQSNDKAMLAKAETSLEIRVRLLGESHRHTATSYHWVGASLDTLGDYKRARFCYEKELDIHRKVYGEQSPLVAFSLRNFSFFLRKNGDLAGARRSLEQQLAIEKANFGDDHRTAVAWGALGAFLNEQGDVDGARHCYEMSLEVSRKANGESSVGYLSTLVAVAQVCARQGDHSRSLKFYQDALVVQENIKGKLPHDKDFFGCRLGLANVYTKIANYEQARKHLDDFVNLRKQSGEEMGIPALTHFVALAFAEGRIEEAIDYSVKVLAAIDRVHGKSHPLYVARLPDHARLLAARGDFAEARRLYEQVLSAHKIAFGAKHIQTASALYDLARVRALQGEPGEASSLILEALAIQRHTLDTSALTFSERQQLAMNHLRRYYLDELLSLPGEAKVSAEAQYQHVLAWKGNVTLRQRKLRLLRNQNDLAPLADELQRVCNRLAALASADFDATKRASQRTFLTELTTRKEEIEIELARKSESYRKDQELEQLSPRRLADALPADTALVDFLEYTHAEADPDAKGKRRHQRRMTAFVLRPGQAVLRVDLGPSENAVQAADAWRAQALKNSTAALRPDGAGAALRKLVWAPLQPHLGDAKRVLLSPDGVIGTIPFLALPGEKAGKYLLEERAVASVPLPRLLPELLATADRAEPETLLLAGDIDYGARADVRPPDLVATRLAVRHANERLAFAPLEGTKQEVVNLQAAFEKRFPQGKVTTLRQGNATEAEFRARASKHRWLHLATHGFFAPPAVSAAGAADAEAPLGLFGKDGFVGFHPGLLSGLALTGANLPPQFGQDDGILTALEVAEMDLRRTELVVLSACETGLGKVAGGEGVLGLQRSFQVAGARTVVASLWSVPDEPTRLLMERFYANRWERKLDKLDALLEAQRWMLREGKDQPGVARGIQRLELPAANIANGKLPPYFWAAFVLSGDWR